MNCPLPTREWNYLINNLGEKAPLNIELHGALGPGRFFGEGDESYIAVVMPMRLL